MGAPPRERWKDSPDTRLTSSSTNEIVLGIPLAVFTLLTAHYCQCPFYMQTPNLGQPAFLGHGNLSWQHPLARCVPRNLRSTWGTASQAEYLVNFDDLYGGLTLSSQPLTHASGRPVTFPPIWFSPQQKKMGVSLLFLDFFFDFIV
jgi:hypothetical protein